MAMPGDGRLATGVIDAVVTDRLLDLDLDLDVDDVAALSRAERVAKVKEAIGDGRLTADQERSLRELCLV